MFKLLPDISNKSWMQVKIITPWESDFYNTRSIKIFNSYSVQLSSDTVYSTYVCSLWLHASIFYCINSHQSQCAWSLVQILFVFTDLNLSPPPLNEWQISTSPSANLSKNSERKFVVPIKKLESGEGTGNIWQRDCM